MGIGEQDAFEDRCQRIQGLYPWSYFYKFLCDNEEQYLRKDGWTDEDMPFLVEDYEDANAKDTIEYCKNNIGYFIEYKYLFSTWLKPDSMFNVADLSAALNNFDRLVSANYRSVYEKIF